MCAHVLLLLFFGLSLGLPPPPNKLLLVVLDGFRWDYVDREDLPGGLAQLRSKGTFAHKLRPVFPSLTYPNLNSLLTGLYPESHGFVSNVMYDPDQQTTFYSPKEGHGSDEYWWNVSTPIWASATANNISTGLYGWPSCGIKVRGQLPTYCVDHVQYQELMISDQHLEDIVTAFADNKLQLAILYVEQVDVVGHAQGPDSVQMGKTLNYVDQLFLNLMESLNERKVKDVNIIVVSDHGMIESDDDPTKHISLNLNLDNVDMIAGDETLMGIYPKAAHFDRVYKKLKEQSGLTALKKQDIPDEYHLKMSNRTAPILLLADPGYVIQPVPEKQIPPMTDSAHYHLIGKGVHGYDPEKVPEMNGILVLYGPAFNRKYEANQLDIIDVYNMMACILDFGGQPNNGSWDHVCPFLRSNCMGHCGSSRRKNTAAISYSSAPVLLLISVVVLILM